MKKTGVPENFLLVLVVGCLALSCARTEFRGHPAAQGSIGRIEVFTIPFDGNLRLRSATYTPSGKVLVSYAGKAEENSDHINLALLDDSGDHFKPFFSQQVPRRPKANGIRYMFFADNRRIFLGDYILECSPSIDDCDNSHLVPVKYPEPVAGGESIMARWSEIIIAPDNRHIAWTTLLSSLSALVFTGELERDGSGYRITKPRVLSTLDLFRPDNKNPGSVVPNILRGGEVKQFVRGGTAISLVGKKESNTADSVVHDLLTGDLEQITHTAAYTETTIFSPDEKLGMSMSTQFSGQSNLAILGLLPRPYPASLDMGLTMLHYTYSVTGVRKSRPGNIGPVLIDIAASRSQDDHQGINLNTSEDWVYVSPMSWHPGGKKAMWIEVLRGTRELRMQAVSLLDYQPEQQVPAQTTPDEIPYAYQDLSVLEAFMQRDRDIDVRIEGRHSGHITYRRSFSGPLSVMTEKRYVNFSDDGQSVYQGVEKSLVSPDANSVYTANVQLAGPEPGRMNLKITFGPIHDRLPARLVFDPDESGQPQTHGYSEYGGKRLSVDGYNP